MSSPLPSPGGGLRQKLTARKLGSGRNVGALSPTNLPPESQFAMKTLNVTVDAGDGSELPSSLTRADIGVQVLVSLENSGHNEKRDEKASKVAESIQTEAQELLTKEFCSEKAVDDCPYLLKVYVVLASERSLLHKLTLGLVGAPQKECLEWFLQSQSPGSSEICKAGRVGGVESTTAQLCQTLVEKLGVPEK